MAESPLFYSFSNLSKVYRLYAAPRDRFFEALTGRPRHAEVRALDDVSGGIAKARSSASSARTGRARARSSRSSREPRPRRREA